jgi:hypothetical protein
MKLFLVDEKILKFKMLRMQQKEQPPGIALISTTMVAAPAENPAPTA